MPSLVSAPAIGAVRPGSVARSDEAKSSSALVVLSMRCCSRPSRLRGQKCSPTSVMPYVWLRGRRAPARLCSA
eukprot:5231350-Pyramimonas_sp.AAC.1